VPIDFSKTAASSVTEAEATTSGVVGVAGVAGVAVTAGATTWATILGAVCSQSGIGTLISLPLYFHFLIKRSASIDVSPGLKYLLMLSFCRRSSRLGSPRCCA
jgi:hypothetical protein